MKSIICTALLGIILAAPLTAQVLPATQQKEQETPQTAKPAYIFGLGISLTDSVVYFSEIQKLEKAVIEKKTQFLTRMPDYADQYQSFLENTYPGHITATVFYAEKKEQVEKKRAKLMRHYAHKKNLMKAVEVSAENFTFTELHPQKMTHSETIPLGVGPAYKPQTQE